MKVFNFNKETGEYIGEEEAEKNPLEPGKYLIPAAATTEPPPKAGTKEAVRFNGQGWEKTPDLRGTVYFEADGTEKKIDRLGDTLPEGALTKKPAPTAEQVAQQEKAEAEIYLRSTEWHVIREIETGEPMPADIKAARIAALANV